MRRMRSVGLILGIVVGLAMTGCGGKTKQASPQTKLPPGVVLPEWAPENPSPEFLRAAKVLKSLPAIEQAQQYSPLIIAAWEFFGSLSDGQTAELLERKQVVTPLTKVSAAGLAFMKEHGIVGREVDGKLIYTTHRLLVPVGALTAKQRKLFDRIAEAYSGIPRKGGDTDLLVALYRIGAKKDLSNVSVQYDSSGGHIVYLGFVVSSPRVAGVIVACIAQI